MNHAVAVRAQQCQIVQLGLGAFSEGFNGFGMMGLNEALSTRSVPVLEVKRTRFTA